MTEDEAKTKWCPFVRAQQFQPFALGVADNPAVNRGEWSVNCLASGCAVWRWRHVSGIGGHAGEISTTDGFCGLAREP